MSRNHLVLVALLLAPLFPACAAQHDGGNTDEYADTADAENALTRPGKFETFVGKDGQFYFHLLAGNGEKILASERYKAKASAENGIESVKKNSPDDARYDRRQAADGQHHFVLKAANGEIIGTSERYTTAASMEKGIASVKANAPSATVVDQSA